MRGLDAVEGREVKVGEQRVAATIGVRHGFGGSVGLGGGGGGGGRGCRSGSEEAPARWIREGGGR